VGGGVEAARGGEVEGGRGELEVVVVARAGLPG